MDEKREEMRARNGVWGFLVQITGSKRRKPERRFNLTIILDVYLLLLS